MVEIQNTLVSLDIFQVQFCCDLAACKGACCIEGDAGAPVNLEEVEGLEEASEIVWDELSRKAQRVIKRDGVVYADDWGELVTSIVDGKDCVFTCYKDGCCFCAIDKAHREGRCPHNKPISCHLYPIRLKKIGDYTALNYHQWSICQPALALGKKLNLPLYRFLKEPLIRAFGQAWYDELELTASELKKHGYIK